MQKTKASTPEANDAARKFAQAVVDREFGGNTLKAAAALGVSQSYVSDFLRGTKGAGTKMLHALANFCGVPLDVVIGRSGATPAPAELDAAISRGAPRHETIVQAKLRATGIRSSRLTADDWADYLTALDAANATLERRASPPVADVVDIKTRKTQPSSPPGPGDEYTAGAKRADAAIEAASPKRNAPSKDERPTSPRR